MWHHNKKNPMVATPAKAPAKPNAANATAQADPKPSPQTSTIKIGSPEIRIGLDGAATRSGMLGKNILKIGKKPTMPTKSKSMKLPKIPKIPKLK
jgi:hypothetical protein